MNIKWDADKYTSDFSFVHQYGNALMELITANGHDTVLDLGCGNGALTQALHEKGYVVKGMDASKELLDIARKNYPALTFFQGDATDFVLPEPVDIVFSNAVFHWIDKERQQDMMKCVHNALKKNGQFIFEFGGYGNNRRIHSALAVVFSEYGYSYHMPFYFPTISEYAALLEQTGFRVTFAVLFDRLTELSGEDGMENWINMFVKTPFSVVQSAREKEVIVSKAAAVLRDKLYIDGKWYADYVRIRMKAIRL